MIVTKPFNSPQELVALREAPANQDVCCVLIGSAAAKFYGAEGQPGDLNIAPATNHGIFYNHRNI